MIYVLKRTLDHVDSRLVAHGERVAYILYDMLRASNTDIKTIVQVCLMGLLHDIGAYKTEEIDRLLEFETKNVSSHAIYGYLYLRNWLPHGQNAEMVLFHHLPERVLKQVKDHGFHRFANMIHLADRLDIYFRSHKTITETYLQYLKSQLIASDLVDLFVKANETYGTIENLLNGNYEPLMTRLSEEIDFSEEEMIQYLQLIVFSIDFRSEHTVNHTILVIELATELAKYMGLSETMTKKVRIGALLHDLGKISTPLSILEKPTSLTKEETSTMKNHVVVTRNILEGFIDDEICRIAYRHHERLNGKGYPEGLRGDQLTLP